MAAHGQDGNGLQLSSLVSWKNSKEIDYDLFLCHHNILRTYKCEIEPGILRHLFQIVAN